MGLNFIKKVRFLEGESGSIYPLKTLPPGTYLIKIDMSGDALLSTLYVSDLAVGASIQVEYFDFTLGGDLGEETPLRSHPAQTTIGTHRQTITNVHNKPVARVIISGGNATFSLYGTMVSTTLSESDTNLVLEAQEVDLVLDKGRVLAGWDKFNNVWRVANIDEFGNLCTKEGQGSNKRLDAIGQHPGDNNNHQDIAVIPLINGRLYSRIKWLVSSFKAAEFIIVHRDNGLENNKSLILVGEETPTESGETDIEFFAGNTGVQELLIKAITLDSKKISQLSGNISVTEAQQ